MKQLLLLILLSSVLRGIAQPQRYMLKRQHFINYEESEFKGQIRNGNRDGIWVDSTKNGIIYQTSIYSNGKPIGLWKLYFPDSKLRKEIEYDTSGNIIKWKRYRENNILVEIIPKFYLNTKTITELSNFEEELFDTETSAYVPKIESERKDKNALDAAYVKTIIEINAIDLNKINSILGDNSFLGKCVIYNQNSLIETNTVYEPNKIELIKYFYKDKKLKKQDVYENHQLIESIIYKSNGKTKILKKEKK